MRRVKNFTAIVFFSALFLNLVPGCGGGGDNPPQQQQQNYTTGGTKTNPTVVSIGTTVTSSITGISSVYFKFTTGSSSGSYGIAITTVQADMAWDLYSSSDYSSFFVASCDKQFTATDEVCSATLDANTTYYLRVYSWDNKQSNYSLTLMFLDPTAGCGSGECINFESGAIPTSFVSSGNASWVVDNANTGSGTYSIHSGVITDSQTSCFEYSPSNNSDVVLFSLKTDSEDSIDQLKFYIDGTMQSSSWSGLTAWTRVIFGATRGSHTYKWCYIKDGSISSGADMVWIDDIETR